MRQWSVTLPILTFLWGATGLAAVAAEETVEDRIDVNLVTVEVMVTDDRGRSVTDLDRSLFRVYEDGEPVAIEHFDPPPGASDRREEEGRPARVVIFIDELHLGGAGRLRVLGQIWTAIEENFGPDDEIMVATYDGRIRTHLPFTSKRKEVLRTLRDLVSLPMHSLSAGLDERRVLNTLRDIQRSRSDENPDGGGAGTCTDVGGIARDYASEVYGRVAGTASALDAFVTSLSGLEGRTAIVHVSDGIPLIAGFEAWTLAIEFCDGSGVREGIDYATDVTALGEAQRHRFDPFAAQMELERFNTTELWIDVAAHANANQVSLYTIQASGISAGQASSVSNVRTTQRTDANRRRNVQDTLALLADETGGNALLNSNDAEPGLERMFADSRHHYLVSYSPPDSRSGSHHRIRVEVDAPDVTVRHRKSYQTKGPKDRVMERVISTLYHGVERNDLSARFDVVEGEGGDTTLRVAIPLRELVLLPSEGARRGRFSAWVVARGESGEAMDLREASIPVRVEPDDVESETFFYEIGIDLAPEAWDIALGIRDDVGGETAYLFRTVDLGE